MLRFVLILSLVAQTAAAVTFPPAATPEQPVSGRVFGPPAGNQQTLAIASNGNVGFAVWLDQRRGTTDLYGSRIDANGVALDPLGISIATGVTGGTVMWSGRQFIALSERGSEKTFTFITSDGDITGRKTLTLLFMAIAATMGSGSDARMLFLGVGKATILDANANIVMENVQLAMPASQSLAVAGTGANEFLILHTNLVPGRHLFADRIDRDGNFLGTVDSGVDLNTIGSTLALAGGNDGYLLVGRGPSEREVLAIHLDPNGVMTTLRTLLAFEQGLRVSLVPIAKPAVLRDGDQYFVTWTTSEPTGDAHTWLVTEPVAGIGSERVQILDWLGSGYGTVIGKITEQPIVVTDAYRIGVSTNIDPVSTVIGKTGHFTLSSTATEQTLPQVATSGNGYAVIWNEFGPDGASHLYLRRFSASAAAAPAIEVASNAIGVAITGRIAAARGTYVVAWSASENVSGSAGYLVRRLSAATGQWLDPGPVPLTSAFEVVLASNGDSVLAVYNIECTFRCPRARSIAADTAATFRGAETIIPGTNAASQLAMSSNGRDYLLVWDDNVCDFSCDSSISPRLLALRLDADGRALDANPIVIQDNGNSLSHDPSVAYAGNSYTVTWDGGNAIGGRHVSEAGVTDPVRTVVSRPSQVRSPFLIGNGNNLFLIYTTQTGDAVSSSGVALDPQSLTVSGGASLLVSEQPANGTISAAALPNGLVVAYDRIDSGGGNVGRVFARVYGESSRHRAVHR